MALAAVSGALLSAANGISARIHAIADALPGGGDEPGVDDVREGELRIPMDRFKLLERLRRGHPKKYAALLQLARAPSAPSVLREPSEVVRQRVANALS